MSFFQNVFNFEFRPTIFGSDRQYQTTWNVPANVNSPEYMINHQVGPYDLSAPGNNVLTLMYAYDPSLLGYSPLNAAITGADMTAVTASEVVSSLNSNSIFSGMFQASLFSARNFPFAPQKILIKYTKNAGGGHIRAYITNTGAETVLQYNRNSPIRQLPTYYERWDMQERFQYPTLGPDRLILLDPGANAYEAQLIQWQGMDPNAPLADWQLLRGSNDAYFFFNTVYNTSGQITQETKYYAGASIGDLAKKTYYLYSGTTLCAKLETPYTLQSGDLISPP